VLGTTLTGIVREGLLLMFEQEVTSLCGETYRPSESIHRRAGSEMVTIQTSSGKGSCVVVALAIDIHGHKHLLDFEEGSSDSAELVKGLFKRLHARGLKVGTVRRLLLFRDGSEAIAKAVRHFWPDAVQQESLVHVERGLCGKLSWKHQKEVVERMNRLRRVQGAQAGEEAFEDLLQFVRGKNLAAVEGLANRKYGILAFHRLNVTFLSTNHFENVMRNSRGMIGKVCRWNPKTDQLTRWMGVALLRAQEGFRRVRGHKELDALAAALGRAGSAASSLRSSSAPPASPSAKEQFELAGEIKFSYQMSIS
jgi:transposase-like protein